MQQVLKIKTSLSRARVRMEREMKGEEKEVKGEVKVEGEETNHAVEKMDTSAAAPADLAGTVMEVTKGKEFKVLICFFIKAG